MEKPRLHREDSVYAIVLVAFIVKQDYYQRNRNPTEKDQRKLR